MILMVVVAMIRVMGMVTSQYVIGDDGLREGLSLVSLCVTGEWPEKFGSLANLEWAVRQSHFLLTRL